MNAAAGHVSFRPVELPADTAELVAFLCGDEWPFHSRRRLTPDDVASMEFASDDVASFWIDVADAGEPVGLVRLFDLGDIDDGAPLFDLRIATPHRGRGLGTRATRWLADHLFGTYPTLHRIEATTRHDNAAMQHVLATAGFVEEGRLREAWVSDDGSRLDTLVFGLLRSDRRPAP